MICIVRPKHRVYLCLGLFYSFFRKMTKTSIRKQEERSKMKLANLVGERTKERPGDCVVDSHALRIKGGFTRFGLCKLLSEISFYDLPNPNKISIWKKTKSRLDSIEGIYDERCLFFSYKPSWLRKHAREFVLAIFIVLKPFPYFKISDIVLENVSIKGKK